MWLQFLGSGDAFGSGGRFNTCMLVETSRTNFLIDCGATSLVAMRAFGAVPNTLSTVFISHFHGDHVGGLPFLLLDAQLVSKRQVPLTVAGPPGLEAHLVTVMEALFPGSSAREPAFELHLVELEPGVQTTVNDVTVTSYPVQHDPNLLCTGLRFEVDGRVLAYSGDTTWTDTLPTLAGGADLFVCEAYLFEGATPQHLDYGTILARRDQLGCKRIMLTHMGGEMLGRLEQVEVEYAEDGMRVAL